VKQVSSILKTWRFNLAGQDEVRHASNGSVQTSRRCQHSFTIQMRPDNVDGLSVPPLQVRPSSNLLFPDRQVKSGCCDFTDGGLAFYASYLRHAWSSTLKLSLIICRQFAVRIFKAIARRLKTHLLDFQVAGRTSTTACDSGSGPFSPYRRQWSTTPGGEMAPATTAASRAGPWGMVECWTCTAALCTGGAQTSWRFCLACCCNWGGGP
jgi:hypothetical protein